MKNLLSIFLFSLSFAVISQQTPKILVSVVVDQMKYEFVDRFWEDFGENGFKKLVNEGVFCRNTHYNYIPTFFFNYNYSYGYIFSITITITITYRD